MPLKLKQCIKNLLPNKYLSIFTKGKVNEKAFHTCVITKTPKKKIAVSTFII